MTAPTETEAPASPTARNMDPNAAQRAKLNDLTASLNRLTVALQGIPEDHPAHAVIMEQVSPLQAQIDSIAAKLARADRLAAIVKFTDPLIAAFGTLQVATTTGIPAKVEVLDVETLRNGAQAKLKSAQATLAILEAVEKAIKAAKIPEDALDELKAIQIVAEGEHAVKIAIASTRVGGGPGRGNAQTSRGELMKIVAANDPAHIGKTVGPGGDWPNFRSAFSSVAPDEYAHAEGRAGRYSAAKMLREKHGFVAEPVTGE